MRKRTTLVGLVATAVAALAVGSFAIASNGSDSARADMNGYQEVTSISTTGLGTFMAQIDDDAMRVDYVLSYEMLESPIQQAHIHFAQRSVNGGVNVFLCANPPLGPPAGTPAPPPCPGPTSGTVEGSFTAANVIPAAPERGIEAGAFAELVRAIRVGHTYANIHTTRWPGGEIRGQINDEDQREFTEGNSVANTSGDDG
jgi:hypothetical protein